MFKDIYYDAVQVYYYQKHIQDENVGYIDTYIEREDDELLEIEERDNTCLVLVSQYSDSFEKVNTTYERIGFKELDVFIQNNDIDKQIEIARF